MKEWLFSVGVFITVLAVLKIIIPKGKTHRTINAVFGIMSIFVFVQPVMALKSDDFSLQSVFDHDTMFQTDFIDYITDKSVSFNKAELKKYIDEEYGADCSVDVYYDTDEKYAIIVKKIVINLNGSVILSNGEHIDIIEEIKKDANKYFNVKTGDVYVNE